MHRAHFLTLLANITGEILSWFWNFCQHDWLFLKNENSKVSIKKYWGFELLLIFFPKVYFFDILPILEPTLNLQICLCQKRLAFFRTEICYGTESNRKWWMSAFIYKYVGVENYGIYQTGRLPQRSQMNFKVSIIYLYSRTNGSVGIINFLFSTCYLCEQFHYRYTF